MIYYKDFAISGTANTETADSGIESTQQEEKTVHALLIRVSKYAGDKIKVYLDREEIACVYDYHFDTEETDDDPDSPLATSKMIRLDIEAPVPVGSTLSVAVSCGATAIDVSGAYVYTK